MKQLTFIAVFVAGCVAVIGGVAYWNSEAPPQKEKALSFIDSQEDYEKAVAWVKSGHPKKAITVIKKYRQAMEGGSDEGKRWLDLFVEASAEMPDIRQLTILYQFSPEAFEFNEKASLMVAEAFVLTGDNNSYQSIRRAWRGKETMKKDWLSLDADHLVLEGERDRAIKLLESQTLKGSGDISRLVKLALIKVQDNPQEAWEHLAEAYEKDPGNAQILSFRGRLLEAGGRSSAALSEYIAATAVDPSNAALREQLADFFIRQKKFLQGLQVLEEAISTLEVSDALMLKVIFWNKVVKPLDIDWSSADIPEGPLKPYLEYLAHMKQWQFWDQKSFSKIENSEKLLAAQPSALWLRVIDALKKGDEEGAEKLLSSSSFTNGSINSDLGTALLRVIRYRTTGSLNVDLPKVGVQKDDGTAMGAGTSAAIPFYSTLEELAKKQRANSHFVVPEPTHKLLMSPFAYSAAFLATEWNEAALELQSQAVVSDDVPDWVAYGLTEALRHNRGNLAALEFATMQHPTPQLELLIAEILLAKNSKDTAVILLEKLAAIEGEVGVRAAWLLSLANLDSGEFDKAKQVIAGNESLAKSTMGTEALARIALAQGEGEAADSFYSSIVGESSEAKSFLARQAYGQKNWEKAKMLTIELLKEYPSSAVLRQNLIKIFEAEKKGN